MNIKPEDYRTVTGQDWLILLSKPTPNVTKIEFLDGVKIKLFWEGRTKVVDLAYGDLPQRFPQLNQTAFFRTGSLDGGSIAWGDLHVDLNELIYDYPPAP